MKTIFGTIGFLAVLVLASGACGGGDDDDAASAGSSSMAGSTPGGAQGSSGSGGAATSGTATSGAAGSKSVAGSASGGGSAGVSAAGSSGSGSGGGSTGAMCSPGDTIPAALAYPDPIQNCGFDGKGDLMGVQGFYRSIKLPKPIGPGDKFSFSVGLDGLGEGTMELWGGSAECGEAHEKLATASIPTGGEPTGIRCMTAEPKEGTYPYLIWVLHAGGAHGSVTLCPDVACP